MDWVRVDVDILRDPEIVMAGRDAFLMYMHGLTYAGEQETDGFVPIGILRLCPWVRSADASAERLASARIDPEPLWIPGDDGYTIRGFTKKQPSRAQAEAERRSKDAEREAARERMRRLRSGSRSGRSSPEQPPNVHDLTGTERERDVEPGLPDLNGQVGLEGVQGEPDRFAADQDQTPEQDPEHAVLGAFTPVLGDRLAYCWAKIRRSGGARWANVIPEVFADLAEKHGSEAVSAAIEALHQTDADVLRAVERPRGYVVKTVADHAGKQAANEAETVAEMATKSSD